MHYNHNEETDVAFTVLQYDANGQQKGLQGRILTLDIYPLHGTDEVPFVGETLGRVW